MRFALVVATALSLGALACASATQQGEQGQPGARRGSNLITRAELDKVQSSSAYDAVQRLRPQWLSRPQAATLQPGGNPILVYVDRRQMGTIEDLRNLPTDQVEQMEFVSARDATTRYGTGHPSGVIEVTTRKR